MGNTVYSFKLLFTKQNKILFFPYLAQETLTPKTMAGGTAAVAAGKPAVAAAAVAATKRIKEKVGGQGNTRAKSRSPNPRDGEMDNPGPHQSLVLLKMDNPGPHQSLVLLKIDN